MSTLQIEVSCPECGGYLFWMEQQRLNRCQFCGSMLYFEHDLEDRFYLEPRVKTPEEIKPVVVASKAEKKRAETIARYPTDDQPTEMLILPSIPLAPFLEEMNAKVSILDAHLIYVPYWHCCGTLYQCLLATSRHEVKEYCFRRVPVDEALPAYDDVAWNFRDRGLRFGEARLKQVTRKMLADNPHLEFSIDFESHLDRIVRAYPPVEGQTDYSFKFHSLCGKQRLPVFRPYWAVSFRCERIENVLVDAIYGTVAGYPEAEEYLKLMSYKKKPYAVADPPKVKIVSSRCPVCGYDSNWSADEAIHFCTNCNRALVLNEGEMEAVDYQYSPAHDSSYVYLPFWKFSVKLLYKNQTYTSLRNYFRLFFQDRVMKDAAHTDSLWIPGAPIKRIKKGDQFFAALIAHASSSSFQLTDGPAPPPSGIEYSELDPVSASELLPAILPTASAVHLSLHKSGSLVQMLKETTIDFGKASLVVLPYRKDREDVIVGKQRFSLKLFEAA